MNAKQNLKKLQIIFVQLLKVKVKNIIFYTLISNIQGRSRERARTLVVRGARGVPCVQGAVSTTSPWTSSHFTLIEAVILLLVRPTDDDMVRKFNPAYVHCIFHGFCKTDILSARTGVSTRMVMYQNNTSSPAQ